MEHQQLHVDLHVMLDIIIIEQLEHVRNVQTDITQLQEIHLQAVLQFKSHVKHESI